MAFTRTNRDPLFALFDYATAARNAGFCHPASVRKSTIVAVLLACTGSVGAWVETCFAPMESARAAKKGSEVVDRASASLQPAHRIMWHGQAFAVYPVQVGARGSGAHIEHLRRSKTRHSIATGCHARSLQRHRCRRCVVARLVPCQPARRLRLPRLHATAAARSGHRRQELTASNSGCP